MGHHFTNFFVAQSNRFAHAAARAVAESPAMAYNPVVIWGENGSGKTHLLQAIQHSIEAHHQSMQITFVTADDLAREFTSRGDETEKDTASISLKEDTYAHCDVLLIDDIQHFASDDKREARSALLDLIEQMIHADKQVVMTCDRSPNEIGGLVEQVRRYEWGLIVDIGSPERDEAEHTIPPS